MKVHLDEERNQWFLSSPRLPHGQLALLEKPFESRSRFGSRSCNLDRQRWCNALCGVPVDYLLERLQEETPDFVKIVDEFGEVELGEVWPEEDQYTDYKFPEDNDGFDDWAKKEVAAYILPLLNGSSGTQIRSILGVRKDGLVVGAPLTDVVNEFNDFRFVEWFDTVRKAWDRIVGLKGFGWITKDKEGRYGVVLRENDKGVESFPIDPESLFAAAFDRYIIEVRVKPQFPHTYINRDVSLVPSLRLKPIGAYLRLRKALRPSFLYELYSERNLALTVGECPSHLSIGMSLSNSTDLERVTEVLLDNSILDVVAIVNIDNVVLLDNIVRKDWKSDRKWTVAVAVSLSISEREIQAFLKKVPGQCKVVEIFLAHPPPEMSLTGLGLSGRLTHHDYFDKVSQDIGDVSDLPRKAKAFIFPESDSAGFPPWGVVRDFVVETSSVTRLVKAVEERLDGPITLDRIIKVHSQGRGVGLTCALTKAALLLSPKYHVFFIRRSARSFDALLAILPAPDEPTVIVGDRHVDISSLFGIERSKTVFVIGTLVDDPLAEHRVRLEWSKNELRRFTEILQMLPFENTITERTRSALDLAYDDGCPFYVMPLVAARGEYKVVDRWIQEQLEHVRSLARAASKLDTLALLTITLDKPVLHTLTNFEEFRDQSQFPLLRRYRCSLSFAHPELARVHLHISKNSLYRSNPFPDKLLDVWKMSQDFFETIVLSNKDLAQRILKQMIFERLQKGDVREAFSSLTKFAFDRRIFEEYLDIAEAVILMSGIPGVDLSILRSRLYRKKGEHGESVDFTESALSLLNHSDRSHLKALNNAFQAYADSAIYVGDEVHRQHAEDVYQKLLKSDMKSKEDRRRLEQQYESFRSRFDRHRALVEFETYED